MITEQRIEWIPKESKPATYGALPPQRQRGRWTTIRARRQGAAAILAPETTKLWPGSQLQNMSSWEPGSLTSSSVTAWDQLPRGDTWYTWDSALMAHRGNWADGTREVIKIHGPTGTGRSPSTSSPELLRPEKGTKRTAYSGLWPCGVPKNLSGLDLVNAWNTGSTWDSALAEHPGA